MPYREDPMMVRFELRPEDVAAFGVHEKADALVRQGRRNEVFRSLGVGAAAGLAVATLGLLDVETGNAPEWTAVAAGLGLTAVRWVTRPARVGRLLRARILQQIGDRVIPTTVVVDASGITDEREDGARSVAWTTVRAIEETADHAFVRDKSPAPIIVPRRAFAEGGGSFRDFVDTCRARAAGGSASPTDDG